MFNFSRRHLFKVSNFYNSIIGGSDFQTFNSAMVNTLPKRKSFFLKQLPYLFNFSAKKFYLKNIIQKRKFSNFRFCVENFFTIYFIGFFKFKNLKINYNSFNSSIIA